MSDESEILDKKFGRLPWRVDDQYGIHVYQGDVPIATFHQPADAVAAVKAYNNDPRYSTKRYSWSQPCCDVCFQQIHPDWQPVRLKPPNTDEVCVYCGHETTSGIYVRVDPSIARHPTLLKNNDD